MCDFFAKPQAKFLDCRKFTVFCWEAQSANIGTRMRRTNFPRDRTGDEKIFFRRATAINSPHSDSSRMISKKHRRGFPARGKHPFDITASKDKIGDSDR
jgi:hypothetical protein